MGSRCKSPNKRPPTAMERKSQNAESNKGNGMKTFGLLLTVFLSGNLFAAVGPNYHRPAVPDVKEFSDAQLGTWKEAAPSDAIARGDWWRVFNDPVLDDLERQATENNQDLK